MVAGVPGMPGRAGMGRDSLMAGGIPRGSLMAGGTPGMGKLQSKDGSNLSKGTKSSKERQAF